MFAVYGMNGRIFSGTSDQLRQVGSVTAATRSRKTQAKEHDEGSGGGWDATSPVETVDGFSRSAIAAYTQTQRGVVDRQPVTRVDQVMSGKVISIDQNEEIKTAWELLSQNGIRQLPVLNEQRILVGMLLRSSLLDALAAHPQVWPQLLAEQVAAQMMTPIPSVAADTDIRRVAQVLLDTGLPGLPVTVEPGVVIGFISRTDILAAVVADPPLDLWG